MRTFLGAALIGGSLLGGCAYHPVPPDPIRIVDSRADVVACRSLGPVSGPVSTEGTGPFLYGSLTQAVPAGSPQAAPPLLPWGWQPTSDHFGIRLQAMRDEALSRGATDLLLDRGRRRDWGEVRGVAYRCPN